MEPCRVCSDQRLPGSAGAPLHLETGTKLGCGIGARLQVQVQCYLNCAHILAEVAEQEGTPLFN